MPGSMRGGVMDGEKGSEGDTNGNPDTGGRKYDLG